MALGKRLWPDAEGRLLYHEYTPGAVETEVPGACFAWRYLLDASGRTPKQSANRESQEVIKA